MDATSFHRLIRHLLAQYELSEERLVSAEKAAFLRMAHHIDLPDAEDSGEATITADTPNYVLELDSGKDIDRITSAVFVTGSTRQPLEDWNIREYQFAYRGAATTGTPYAYCYYNDHMWLYYIPEASGTVYFTCQHVLTDLSDFPDNYYPLMIALVKTHIFKSGSGEWWAAYRETKDLLKSFKQRMHPLKKVMEKTTYRAERIKALNELI